MCFLIMSICSGMCIMNDNYPITSPVVATPLFGWLCDSAFSPWVVSACGSVLVFICFGLIGEHQSLSWIDPLTWSQARCPTCQPTSPHSPLSVGL